MKQSARPRPSLESLSSGIIAGDRLVLAQAITVIESHLPSDEELAAALLEKIMPHTGHSIRLGITGVPGVGKSTFIESLGQVILKNNKKVAVLSIDPTSPIGGGSILGDKTRMETLSKNPNAYIRPSASQESSGGVASRTRESMLLCEAAGFDVVIVETVGVGQSEYAVKDMVDFFLLLLLAGAGDDLQGMKKGIMELADTIVITKADGDNLLNARQAQATFAQVMHVTRTGVAGTPPVLLTSAITNTGMSEVWSTISDFVARTQKDGSFEEQRRQQYASWVRDSFSEMLKADIQRSDHFQQAKASLQDDVAALRRSPRSAASELLRIYHSGSDKNK